MSLGGRRIWRAQAPTHAVVILLNSVCLFADQEGEGGCGVVWLLTQRGPEARAEVLGGGVRPHAGEDGGCG